MIKRIILVLGALVILSVVEPKFSKAELNNSPANSTIMPAPEPKKRWTTTLTEDLKSRLDISGKIVIKDHNPIQIRLDELMAQHDFTVSKDIKLTVNDSSNSLEIEITIDYRHKPWWIIDSQIQFYVHDLEPTKHRLTAFVYNPSWRFDKHYKCELDLKYPLYESIGPEANGRLVDGYLEIDHLELQLNSENGSLAEKFSNEPDPLSCTDKRGSALSFDHKSRLDINATINIYGQPSLDFTHSLPYLNIGKDVIKATDVRTYHFTQNHFTELIFGFVEQDGQRVSMSAACGLSYLEWYLIDGLEDKIRTPLDKHYRCDSRQRFYLYEKTDPERTKKGYIDIEYLEFELFSDRLLDEGFSDNVDPKSC